MEKDSKNMSDLSSDSSDSESETVIEEVKCELKSLPGRYEIFQFKSKAKAGEDTLLGKEMNIRADGTGTFAKGEGQIKNMEVLHFTGFQARYVRKLKKQGESATGRITFQQNGSGWIVRYYTRNDSSQPFELRRVGQKRKREPKASCYAGVKFDAVSQKWLAERKWGRKWFKSKKTFINKELAAKESDRMLFHYIMDKSNENIKLEQPIPKLNFSDAVKERKMRDAYLVNSRVLRGQKSSLYKNISFVKSNGKWRARISHNSRQLRIGEFDSELAAVEAINRKCDSLGIDRKCKIAQVKSAPPGLPQETFKQGELVECLFHDPNKPGAKPGHFKATITRVYPNNTYDIEWEDGDQADRTGHPGSDLLKVKEDSPPPPKKRRKFALKRSKYVGVRFDQSTGRWFAIRQVDGDEVKSEDQFDDEQEAARASDRIALDNQKNRSTKAPRLKLNFATRKTKQAKRREHSDLASQTGGRRKRRAERKSASPVERKQAPPSDLERDAMRMTDEEWKEKMQQEFEREKEKAMQKAAAKLEKRKKDRIDAWNQMVAKAAAEAEKEVLERMET